MRRRQLPTANGFEPTARVPESNSISERIDWQRFAPRDSDATVQLRTAKSCAFACAFCDYPVRAGPLALADLECVEAQLDTLRHSGVRRLIFIDDTLNVPPRRFEEMLRMLIRRRWCVSVWRRSRMKCWLRR